MNSRQGTSTESIAPRARRTLRIGMVIAYCHPDRVGGTEWQARLLSRTLARRGHEVVLFALNPGNERPARETLDGFRIMRVPSLIIRGRLRGGGMGSPILLWRYAAAILAEEAPFDVLHSHLAAHPTAGASIAARRRGTPLLVKLACSGPHGDLAALRGLSLRAHGPLVRRLVSRADRIVAMTEDLEHEAIAFGFAPAAIARIPNGVELPDLTIAGAPANATAMNGPATDAADANIVATATNMMTATDSTNAMDAVSSTADAPSTEDATTTETANRDGPRPRTVIAVGRLDTQKRLDLLVHAVAALGSRLGAARVLVYGEGPRRSDLEALAAETGVGSTIRFLGRHPPERIYPPSDLFVLPSDDEGMSNALLEAMAWGKPCLVSDIAANRETAGDAACYFERGNAGALASALAHLLASPDDARDLGKRARDRAEQTFAIERVADRYEALYDSLASAGAGA